MSTEKNFENILQKLYYDPSSGYKSANTLYKNAKEQEPKITLKIVKEFVKKQATEQINKEVNKQNISKKNIPILGPVGHYQCDITDYPKYYKQNDGHRYILTFIEINSKKAHAIPLKNKTKLSVLNALKTIIDKISKDKQKITVIQSDLGNEFNNKEVKSYLNSIFVEQRYCNVGDKKCMSVVERFNKTIRSLITKYMVAHNTTRWIDNLQKFIDNYNNTYHSSIKMKPKDVDEKKEEVIIMDKNNQILEASNDKKQNVNVGDFVRIKLKKALFSKLGRNFSQEIYKVIKVNKFSVKLEFDSGEPYDKLVRIDDIQVIPKDTINVDNNNIKQVEKEHKVMTRLRRELSIVPE